MRPGSLTPSRAVCRESMAGDLVQCLEKVKALSEWEGGSPASIRKGPLRAKGVSCLRKAGNPPPIRFGARLSP